MKYGVLRKQSMSKNSAVLDTSMSTISFVMLPTYDNTEDTLRFEQSERGIGLRSGYLRCHEVSKLLIIRKS